MQGFASGTALHLGAVCVLLGFDSDHLDVLRRNPLLRRPRRARRGEVVPLVAGLRVHQPENLAQGGPGQLAGGVKVST